MKHPEAVQTDLVEDFLTSLMKARPELGNDRVEAMRIILDELAVAAVEPKPGFNFRKFFRDKCQKEWKVHLPCDALSAAFVEFAQKQVYPAPTT